MLGSAKLMSFVATTNAAKAREFYGGTLGLKFVSEDPFAVVFDANGTMLRVQIVAALNPHPFTALGWQVSDIAATVTSLTQAGVRFEIFAGLGQDASGVWTSPAGAKIAWFKDPEGNILSSTEF